MTTKILALTDALGNLVRFVLLPGQRFDTVGVPPLIDGLAFAALIARGLGAWIQHQSLLRQLHRTGAIPHHYVHFLDFAAEHHIEVTTPEYPLSQADRALSDLSGGQIAGAAVLLV